MIKIKINCPLCNTEFDSENIVPKVLKCGHTYCIKCIKKQYKEKGKIACEKCNVDYCDDYDKLPTNLTLFKLHKKHIFEEMKNKPSVGSRKINKKYISKTLEIVKEISCSFSKGKITVFNRNLKMKNIKYNISDYKKYDRIKSSFEKYKQKSGGKIITNRDNNNIEEIDLLNEINEYNSNQMLDEPLSLYNYFEMLKDIYNYSNKFKNKGILGKIFNITYSKLILSVLIVIHYFLFVKGWLSFAFIFISVIYEKEENIYQIKRKLKMLICLITYVFVSNIYGIIGIKYIIESMNIEIFNKILNILWILFILCILGNETTLNLVVTAILNSLAYLNLLLPE